MTQLLPDGFGWRKYDCPVPLYRHGGGAPDPACRAYLLWPGPDEGRCRQLRRWEGLAPAYLGVISHGYGPPVAVAYAAGTVFQLLAEGKLLTRSWIPAADAAEAVEFVRHNLLGVWMGGHTPFLVSVTHSWDELVEQHAGNFD